MLLEFKKKFHSDGTNKNEKIQILTLFPKNWNTHKIAKVMNTSFYMVQKARDLKIQNGILSVPKAKKGFYYFQRIFSRNNVFI